MLRIKYKYYFKTTFYIALLFLLQSCSNKGLENLGLLKQKANEYAIARKAPLVMPPDMYLRPPKEEKKPIKSNKKNLGKFEETLEDILLEDDILLSEKNSKRRKRLPNKDKRIVKKILKTKASIVLK